MGHTKRSKGRAPNALQAKSGLKIQRKTAIKTAAKIHEASSEEELLQFIGEHFDDTGKKNKLGEESSSTPAGKAAKKIKKDSHDSDSDDDADMESGSTDYDSEEPTESHDMHSKSNLANQVDNSFKMIEKKRRKSLQKEASPTPVLPAIKLHINESVADQFKNPINLKKEIDRCFSGHALKIKFASLSRANLLIIATDDQTTHALLSSAWPADAFARGARPMDVKHNSKGTSKASAVLIIRHVHVCLDILDEETAKQLADQGVTMAKRITSRSGNPTTIVTAKPGPDANIKNLTQHGVFIGYTRHKVELESKTLQCFNCQQLGHTAHNCTNKLACIRCGGEHKHKDGNNECTVQLRCVNCNGNHASCSRSCPAIKSVTGKIQPTQAPASSGRQDKSFAAVVSGSSSSTNNSSSTAPISTSSTSDEKINELSVKVATLTDLFHSMLAMLKQLLPQPATASISNQQQQQQQLDRLAPHIKHQLNRLPTHQSFGRTTND